MDPEVLDAMREAASSYVVLEELQSKASEVIARATGAEAGMVTGGAAAGLLVGTAACVAGEDPAKIERLPNTEGMKNEVVMHRVHRNGYDHSLRAAGVKMVEVGYGHDTMPYQLEAAINDSTALVFYVMSPWAVKRALPLAETCEIAHRYGIPVMVDAAAVLPPATNLRQFIEEGADLVVFSGGKGIRGPQSSGILAGRVDLVRAASKNGSPNHSIGRTGKAAKEDIVGLLVALERYLARDHAVDMKQWREQSDFIVEQLQECEGVEARTVYDPGEHITPRTEILFGPESGIDAHELVTDLEEGTPRIFLFEPNGPTARLNSVVVNTHTMQTGEEHIVAKVLRAALEDRLGKPPTLRAAGS